MNSVFKPRKTKIFVFGFMFVSIACTAYPWINNFFTSSSSSSIHYRSQFSSIFSYIFPNSSLVSTVGSSGSGLTVDFKQKDGILVKNLGKKSADNKKGGSLNERNMNGSRVTVNLIKSLIECDLFQGKWVKDESYPLYTEGSCPHIYEAFNCFLNGRLDKSYQKLRWQPNECNIPR